jgi:glucosamine--fructose-6-phosphate aminotransferase (isomerizing)
MCGIVGGIGIRNIHSYLLQSLRRLEYRGYDSAGIALIDNGQLTVHKAVGMIDQLAEELEGKELKGSVGIAHTRWATHGAPTKINAHPHLDNRGELAIVHNGIIENHDILRKRLEKKGCQFVTETDSETLAHLIAFYYKDGVPLEEATRLALCDVEGTYGLVVISAREPDTLVAARMGSPLILGIGDGCNIVASDHSAIISHTQRVIYLEDGEIARLGSHNHSITSLQREKRTRECEELDFELHQLELGDFPHYMLKEIYEQPQALENTMRGRLLPNGGEVKLGGLATVDDRLLRAERIILTGCGTAWHAGLIGEHFFESLAGVPTEIDYASELRYRNPLIRPDRDVGICISQSGETADTLSALREMKLKGATVIGVCNVVGSSIARETDAGVFTHAGPEIGVASTKAFICQILVLLLISLRLGRRWRLSGSDIDHYARNLIALPDAVRQALKSAEQVQEIAKGISSADHCLYLGRGLNFPIALEGALKMKEISYIHAEGYPAAEMKHGPIALIDENMPAVVIATKDRVYDKVLANIEEVRARGGNVIAVATEGDERIKALAQQVIYVPEVIDILQPFVNVVPLQLLAYYCALERGCNVDKPRNLAKSVTVE